MPIWSLPAPPRDDDRRDAEPLTARELEVLAASPTACRTRPSPSVSASATRPSSSISERDIRKAGRVEPDRRGEAGAAKRNRGIVSTDGELETKEKGRVEDPPLDPRTRDPATLRAAARRAAVGALVAGPAAHHDRAAGRARRRVFLVLDRRERRHRLRRHRTGRRRAGGRGHVERQLLRRTDVLVAVVHAHSVLRVHATGTSTPSSGRCSRRSTWRSARPGSSSSPTARTARG